MTLWHRIAHPCVWCTPEDLPRLRANARLPFWKPKFAQWRQALAGKDCLPLRTATIDFHRGSNTEALQAALCYVVDEQEHYGRLIASFLEQVVGFYRDHGPRWHQQMAGIDKGTWVGNQWGGLADSFIVDPMMWFSCAHLYDLIYGKDLLSAEDAATFEQMMGRFHRLACLHEELKKLDNNRAAWINGGSYLSTLFDEDDRRAELCRRRAKGNLERLISTILDDGLHYEIGSYAFGTIAAMHMSARCMKNVEGEDFFHRRFDGVGLEDTYRAWVKLLIPGSSLRLPLIKDRVNHWDSTCGGYLEYRHPQLAWAIARMGERPWVPMFRHWPQGAEFYSYVEPDNAEAPSFLDSHLPDGGVAVLRSSWRPEARSLYFRYGFQGSSHGGGLDKLNIELTCNDEPLLADSLLSEYSHYKNVVLVDHQNQAQCSGKCLGAQLDGAGRVQWISALGGFGQTPDREVFHDPRIELGYWSTTSPECFPGVARMRRTIIFVDRRYFIVRDTLRCLDQDEHDYQWLFHTFAEAAMIGPRKDRHRVTYHPRKIYVIEQITPETRMLDRHTLTEPGRLELRSPRARLGMFFLASNARTPDTVSLWHGTGRYSYNGSPETGDGFATAPMTSLQLQLTGRDVVMTTVLDAQACGDSPYVQEVRTLESANDDQQVVQVRHAAGEDVLIINESDQPLTYDNRTWTGISCLVSGTEKTRPSERNL